MSSPGYILVLPEREFFRESHPNAWAAGSAVRIYKDPRPFYVFNNSRSASKIYKIKEKGEGGNKTVANANSYAQLIKNPIFKKLVNDAEKNTLSKREFVAPGNYIRLKKPKGYLSRMKVVESVTKNKKSGKVLTVRLRKGKKNRPISDIVLIRSIRNGGSSTNRSKKRRVNENNSNN